MNFNLLTESYWSQQAERIDDAVDRINERTQTSPGRVIPETDDLVIGAGRHMPLAIMFLDICAFSSRRASDESDQLQLLAVLNLFLTEMFRIAEDYGGTVEKNTGDGLMAYFEDAPSKYSANGSHRAVACALTMKDVTDFLINPVLQRSNIDAIRFRIGINTGPVTIARLGNARRFNAIAAIGTPANIASKMLEDAGPQQVLIGDMTKRNLPEEWQRKWTQLFKTKTGWTYTSTGADYMFHLYTGRWKWGV